MRGVAPGEPEGPVEVDGLLDPVGEEDGDRVGEADAEATAEALGTGVGEAVGGGSVPFGVGAAAERLTSTAVP